MDLTQRAYCNRILRVDLTSGQISTTPLPADMMPLLLGGKGLGAWLLYTEQAAGTDVPVYNSVIGHTINDIAVAQGTGTYGALSFSLSCDLGTEMVNTMDGKSAGSKTIPTSYIITTINQSLTVETTDEWQMASMDGDTWTAGNITITCANGVTAENSTITLTNWVPSELNIPLEAEGMVSFGHSFEPGPGTMYNRVTFA